MRFVAVFVLFCSMPLLIQSAEDKGDRDPIVYQPLSSSEQLEWVSLPGAEKYQALLDQWKSILDDDWQGETVEEWKHYALGVGKIAVVRKQPGMNPYKLIVAGKKHRPERAAVVKSFDIAPSAISIAPDYSNRGMKLFYRDPALIIANDDDIVSYTLERPCCGRKSWKATMLAKSSGLVSWMRVNACGSRIAFSSDKELCICDGEGDILFQQLFEDKITGLYYFPNRGHFKNEHNSFNVIITGDDGKEKRHGVVAIADDSYEIGDWISKPAETDEPT